MVSDTTIETYREQTTINGEYWHLKRTDSGWSVRVMDTDLGVSLSLDIDDDVAARLLHQAMEAA